MPDVEGVLAHYGKKGMKWGVRKRSDGTPEHVVQIKTTKGGPKAVGGGKGYKPSDEAMQTVASRKKATESGLHTLSNKEIKDVNERLGLEAQFRKNTTKPKSPLRKAGETAVIGLIATEGAKQLKNLPKHATKVKQLLDVVDWDYLLTKAG